MNQKYIKKIENKYSSMMRKILDKNGFEFIEIIENRKEPFSWLVYNYNENDIGCEDFDPSIISRKVISAIRKAGF